MTTFSACTSPPPRPPPPLFRHINASRISIITIGVFISNDDDPPRSWNVLFFVFIIFFPQLLSNDYIPVISLMMAPDCNLRALYIGEAPLKNWKHRG